MGTKIKDNQRTNHKFISTRPFAHSQHAARLLLLRLPNIATFNSFNSYRIAVGLHERRAMLNCFSISIAGK